MDTVECVVIGAGAIGIAIARELAMQGYEVVVLETEGGFGRGISSRNSEVIHAGIYYPEGSLKAALCVEGRSLLDRFCKEFGVDHKVCGKLIVATSDREEHQLGLVMQNGRRNGVSDLAMLSKSQLATLEPALAATSAIWSPSTGIVDSHGFMQTMVAQAEEHGVLFCYNSPVEAIDLAHRVVIEIGGRDPMKLCCKWLINAAGLNAVALANQMVGFPKLAVPPSFWAKGSYFSLVGIQAPFSRLIYPLPHDGGLGTHLTLDLSGQARFGPDIEWTDEIDFTVESARSSSFYSSIRRYWPDLPDGSLVPAYAGVRPKIVPPNVATQDFRIDGPAEHGVPGVIQLFGIESPGLTASLSIARKVNGFVEAFRQ